jgi:hypothetical protein
MVHYVNFMLLKLLLSDHKFVHNKTCLATKPVKLLMLEAATGTKHPQSIQHKQFILSFIFHKIRIILSTYLCYRFIFFRQTNIHIYIYMVK